MRAYWLALALLTAGCEALYGDFRKANPGDCVLSGCPSGQRCDERTRLCQVATAGEGQGGDLGAMPSPQDAVAQADGPPSYPLTVRVLGIAGTDPAVCSLPPGIACSDVCSSFFIKGTRLTLKARASSGHCFAGWRGACAGNGDCEVAVDAPVEVAAEYKFAFCEPKLDECR